MKPWTIDKETENGIQHRIYDLSIEDLQERRSKSVLFQTGEKAAQFLGIQRKYLYEIRIPGKRYFSKKHGKSFAVRIERAVNY